MGSVDPPILRHGSVPDWIHQWPQSIYEMLDGSRALVNRALFFMLFVHHKVGFLANLLGHHEYRVMLGHVLRSKKVRKASNHACCITNVMCTRNAL